MVIFLLLLKFPRKNLVFSVGGGTAVKTANAVIPSNEVVTPIIITLLFLGYYMFTKDMSSE